MSDTIGADTIPLPTPVGKDPVADASLLRLAEFFQAVVNRAGLTAWLSVMPNSLPVQFIFTHNPEEVSFNDRQLPAIYLYRQHEEPFERLAEDVDLVHWMLRLLWVFPTSGQEAQRFRSSYAAAGVAALLKHFIELGRDPSYVIPGDTDPRATTEGSVIYRAAGVWELKWNGSKTGFGVPIKGMGETLKYYHLDAQILFTEQRKLDIYADFPTNKGGPFSGGLDLTITTPDKARDLAVAKL